MRWRDWSSSPSRSRMTAWWRSCRSRISRRSSSSGRMDEGLLEANSNGATEVTPSSEVMNGRKRRGSDSHIRQVLDGTVVIATAPERRPVGVSRREGYQRSRRRKLTIEERDAIRSETNSGRSLRSLAGAFGVSHETIRAVLRDRRTDARVRGPGNRTRETLTPRLARPFDVQHLTGNETLMLRWLLH